MKPSIAAITIFFFFLLCDILVQEAEAKACPVCTNGQDQCIRCGNNFKGTYPSGTTHKGHYGYYCNDCGADLPEGCRIESDDKDSCINYKPPTPEPTVTPTEAPKPVTNTESKSDSWDNLVKSVLTYLGQEAEEKNCPVCINGENQCIRCGKHFNGIYPTGTTYKGQHGYYCNYCGDDLPEGCTIEEDDKDSCLNYKPPTPAPTEAPKRSISVKDLEDILAREAAGKECPVCTIGENQCVRCGKDFKGTYPQRTIYKGQHGYYCNSCGVDLPEGCLAEDDDEDNCINYKPPTPARSPEPEVIPAPVEPASAEPITPVDQKSKSFANLIKSALSHLGR